jgi:hypothetical protein
MIHPEMRAAIRRSEWAEATRTIRAPRSWDQSSPPRVACADWSTDGFSWRSRVFSGPQPRPEASQGGSRESLLEVSLVAEALLIAGIRWNGPVKDARGGARR